MDLFFSKKKDSRIKGKIFRHSDLLFFIAFIFVAIYFFCIAPYGITESDESLYQFFVFRITKGDMLFKDDWSLSNLIAFFTYLPFRITTAILGDSEGLIIVLRYLYYGIKMLLFVFTYFSLKNYGVWSVFAGLLFVGTDVFGLKTISYYSVCINSVFLVGMILFSKKTSSPIWHIIAGFLFSCAAIAEPPVVLVWFFYSAFVFAVWLRKKAEKPVLDAFGFITEPKVFWGLFGGICIAVVVFLSLCVILFCGNDIKSVITGIRMAVQFLSINTQSGVSTTVVRLMKIITYALYFHPILFIAFFVVFILAVPLHPYTKKHERFFFLLISVLFVFMSVRLILIPFEGTGMRYNRMFIPPFVSIDDSSGECVCHPFLFSVLAIVAYTFTKKKNRKLFAFLLMTFMVSVAVDIFSNNSFGTMLLAGSVPSALLFRDYFIEQKIQFKLSRDKHLSTEPKQSSLRTKKAIQRFEKAYFPYLCALLCFIVSFEALHYVYMAQFYETERGFCGSSAPLDTKIGDGLLKGVITTEDIAATYEKSVADASEINQICKKGLIVLDFDTTVYLNADRPVYTPTVHVSGDNWEVEEKWWMTHPEKLPDVAYIPFFSMSYIDFDDISPEEKLAYFNSVADTTVTKGEMGFIVQLSNWHLPGIE